MEIYFKRRKMLKNKALERFFRLLIPSHIREKQKSNVTFNLSELSAAISTIGILRKPLLPLQQLRRPLPVHQLQLHLLQLHLQQLHLPLPRLRQQNDYQIFHVSLMIPRLIIAIPYRINITNQISMTIILYIITLTKILMLETRSDSQKLVPRIGISQVRFIKNQMAHLKLIVIQCHHIGAVCILLHTFFLQFQVQMDM